MYFSSCFTEFCEGLSEGEISEVNFEFWDKVNTPCAGFPVLHPFNECTEPTWNRFSGLPKHFEDVFSSSSTNETELVPKENATCKFIKLFSSCLFAHVHKECSCHLWRCHQKLIDVIAGVCQDLMQARLQDSINRSHGDQDVSERILHLRKWFVPYLTLWGGKTLYICLGNVPNRGMVVLTCCRELNTNTSFRYSWCTGRIFLCMVIL